MTEEVKNENPIDESAVQQPQPSKKDALIGSLITVTNVACDAVGNVIDANEARAVVGVNLIANIFAGASDASKRDMLNRVIDTLVQASGLNFQQQAEEAQAPAPEGDTKTEA